MIKFHIQIEIERPVDEVFGYVTDPSKLPNWQTNTVLAEMETDGPFGIGTRLHEVHRAPGGKELHSRVEVSQYELDKRLELRIIDGPLRVDGLFLFEAIADGRTRLELFGTGHPTGAARIAAPLLKLFIRRQFAGNLRALRVAMEEAEPASRQRSGLRSGAVPQGSRT
jgi:uncharacterized protein YndB with AHSA1/START domain